jgi:hypothetical protein
MYSSIAVKLKKSKRVKGILERDGLTNNKDVLIVLTNKIYNNVEFKEIENYFYRKYSELNIQIDEEVEKKRREFLISNLKLPRGLKLPDVTGFINHSTVFHKLKKKNLVTAGVAMENFIITGNKEFQLLNKIPQQNNRVYAFQLCESIKKEKNFLKHNPNIDITKPAFYVGQTSKSRNERYSEHRGGIRANRFMEIFGLDTYEAADKTYELAKLFNVPVDNLRYYEAQENEFKLTTLLQENGYGAYCN